MEWNRTSFISKPTLAPKLLGWNRLRRYPASKCIAHIVDVQVNRTRDFFISQTHYNAMVGEFATRPQTRNLMGLFLIAIGVVLLILSTTQFVITVGTSTFLNSPLADALWAIGLLITLAGEAILIKGKAFLASSAITAVAVWVFVLFIISSWQGVI